MKGREGTGNGREGEEKVNEKEKRGKTERIWKGR